MKAVFIETSVPSKNIRSLIEGCTAAGNQLAIGGELYSDAMGPSESPAGTYIGMIRFNVDQIARGAAMKRLASDHEPSPADRNAPAASAHRRCRRSRFTI